MSVRLPTAYHVATMAPYLPFRYPSSMWIPVVTIGEVVTTLHSPIAVVVGSLSNLLLSLAALLRGRKTPAALLRGRRPQSIGAAAWPQDLREDEFCRRSAIRILHSALP